MDEDLLDDILSNTIDYKNIKKKKKNKFIWRWSR